jgi:hypothetical protein
MIPALYAKPRRAPFHLPKTCFAAYLRDDFRDLRNARSTRGDARAQVSHR